MTIPSWVPPGTHEVRITWKSKRWNLPEKVLTFEVANPLFGTTEEDPVVKSWKAEDPESPVIVLQDGRGSASLKLKEYKGCADAYLSTRGSQEGNIGADLDLLVGNYGGVYTALVKFDLSSLPAGKKIKRATMKLYAASGGRAAVKRIMARRVLKPWGEGSGHTGAYGGRVKHSWSMRGSGASKKGESAWLYSRKPERWAAPGCRKNGEDRSLTGPLPSTEKAVYRRKDSRGRIQERFWANWDLSAYVRDWAAHPEKNFGVQLDGEKMRGYVSFVSADHADPRFRPKLIIQLEK